jgi:hypothetical protein
MKKITIFLVLLVCSSFLSYAQRIGSTVLNMYNRTDCIYGKVSVQQMAVLWFLRLVLERLQYNTLEQIWGYLEWVKVTVIR